MSMATAAAAIDFVGLLGDTCTIRDYTFGAKDSRGNKPKIWADTKADVACRLDEGKGQEIIEGMQVVKVDYTLFMAADEAVTEKSQITAVVRSGTTIEAGPCDVKKVTMPGGQSHHKELWLTKVRT